MIICNGQVFSEDKRFEKKDLYIENGMIVSNINEVKNQTIVDASGCYVLPGLVDIHSHGACGYDFSDADEKGLHTILQYQRAHGITSYCPTSMTLPKEQLREIFKIAKQAKENQKTDEAQIVGINMEGPFLNIEKKGAHKAEYILEPDVDFFRECNQYSGNMIRIVTVSPNQNTGMEFINKLKEEVIISLGHTSADYETAKKAIDAGAHHVTHLFNAMMPLGHRDSGLIGAALEDKEGMVELICDGIHVHESMIRAAFQLFHDRVILISDSMRATGMKNGIYDLGGQFVMVEGKKATLQDGTIAGSVTNLYECMCRAIKYGIEAEQAIAAATVNPAKSIGIYDKVGSLSVGKKADVLIVSKEFELLQVI